MTITKHAYRRARQRLGLNRKAFKRAVLNNSLPMYCTLAVIQNRVVTVKNEMRVGRETTGRINKINRLDLVI